MTSDKTERERERERGRGREKAVTMTLLAVGVQSEWVSCLISVDAPLAVVVVVDVCCRCWQSVRNLFFRLLEWR